LSEVGNNWRNDVPQLPGYPRRENNHQGQGKYVTRGY
jgi:hypothetical protein